MWQATLGPTAIKVLKYGFVIRGEKIACVDLCVCTRNVIAVRRRSVHVVSSGDRLVCVVIYDPTVDWRWPSVQHARLSEPRTCVQTFLTGPRFNPVQGNNICSSPIVTGLSNKRGREWDGESGRKGGSKEEEEEQATKMCFKSRVNSRISSETTNVQSVIMLNVLCVLNSYSGKRKMSPDYPTIQVYT